MKISSRNGWQNCDYKRVYLHATCHCHWDRQTTTSITSKIKSHFQPCNPFFYICEYLGVTPREFFDEGNPYPEALQEFIEEGKKLDPKSMAYLLGIMKELNSKK